MLFFGALSCHQYANQSYGSTIECPGLYSRFSPRTVVAWMASGVCGVAFAGITAGAGATVMSAGTITGSTAGASGDPRID